MTGTTADLTWGPNNSHSRFSGDLGQHIREFGGLWWVTTGKGGIKGFARWGLEVELGGRRGVYLPFLPAGEGREGDCIYINTPLKQLRPWTKQQRLASHIVMAVAAPWRLETGRGRGEMGRTRYLARWKDWAGHHLKTTAQQLKRQWPDVPAICNLQSDNLSPLCYLALGLRWGLGWKEQKSTN